MDGDENAVRVIEEYRRIEGLRGQWESVWEQIARRVLPHYVDQFTAARTSMLGTTGRQAMEDMVDATGALALVRFASIMDWLLTPRGSTWHYLKPSNPLLLKDRAVRLWFDEVTRLLFQYRYAPKANFASQKHENYLTLGAFGTSVLFTDALVDRFERGLRYRSVPLGQCFFMENHQGLIDRNYRRFPLTARQAVQQFGDALPKTILEEARTSRAEQVHWFLHKVAPRDEADYDPERKDLKGMPFVSCYVSITGQTTVQEGGYFTFPYSISRYITTPGELYGRSPAMFALPSLKTLNEIKKTMLKQGHRSVDPVLLAHDDGVLDSFSLRPGAINPGGVNADGRPLIHTLPVGNLAAGKDQSQEERQVINEFFLVSLFQILIDTPQMTATEVVERAREKGALLSPTMGRQQSEALGPQIERELDVLLQQRLLPPMPPALIEARGEYQIQYDSPLSRMSRAEEVSGLMRTVDYLRDVVQVTQNPEPLDHFDWDTIVPEMCDLQAVPARWRKSLDAVQQLRRMRAQQAELRQAVEIAPAASSVVKTLLPKPQPMPNA